MVCTLRNKLFLKLNFLSKTVYYLGGGVPQQQPTQRKRPATAVPPASPPRATADEPRTAPPAPRATADPPTPAPMATADEPPADPPAAPPLAQPGKLLYIFLLENSINTEFF